MLTVSAPTPTAFIAAISSDIGRSIAQIYRRRNWPVIGTYRSDGELGSLRSDTGISLIRCDLEDPGDIEAVGRQLAQRESGWDIFIGAVGQLAPIGPFFELDRGEWTRSVALNGTGQLSLLHAIYPHRRAAPLAQVAFLVGGAINRAFANYSAYSLGKLTLVKFCELIHDECPDIHAVALGTGWVATKIHRQTIAAGALAGDNLAMTEHFLESGLEGTSISDIVACLDWCFAQDRATTGGRNFSVVHDPWRRGGLPLAESLRKDADKFKLRRHGNAAAASPLDT